MRARDWAARLIFVDDGLIAVAKPPGVLTHPGGWSRDTYSVLVGLRSLFGQHVYPLHRLDRATSGVLLFARNSPMASRYRTVFETNQLKKTYLAVVRGWPDEEGMVDRALKCPETGRVKNAKTTFRRLATAAIEEPLGKFPTGRFGLVEVELETGRWHQIRRHMNGETHPVVGDSTHGDTRFNRYSREQLGIERLMLHASTVEFDDPRGFGPRRFEAPLERDMADVFERLRWRAPAMNQT